MAFDGRNARMKYEMVLRYIARLIEGQDPGRGALDGYADADWWDAFVRKFVEEDRNYEINVIKGIMKGLDTIREKIERLEARITELENR